MSSNAERQIRIVTDTHDGSAGEGKPKKKKKKPHRGYAFVVYERERDMKGMYLLHPVSSDLHLSENLWSPSLATKFH